MGRIKSKSIHIYCDFHGSPTDFHKAVLESHSHQIRPSYVHPVDLFNTRLGSESVLEFKLSKTTTMGPQLGRSPAITKAIK